MILDFYINTLRLWMGLCMIWGTAALVVCFGMAPFLAPKPLAKKYLNAPYFDPAIVYFCKSFYYRCYFVQGLILMLNISWLARLRKASEIVADCPMWWLIISRIYFWFLVVPVYVSFTSLSVDCLFFTLCKPE